MILYIKQYTDNNKKQLFVPKLGIYDFSIVMQGRETDAW